MRLLPTAAAAVAALLLVAAKPESRPKPPKPGEKLQDKFTWCEEGGPAGDCLCFLPLPCPKAGCRTYDQELSKIEHKLKAKKPNIDCRSIEVGACGPWRYLHCDLGPESYRLKVYDENGTLRSIRRLSDTKDFCGGSALKSYAGEIPLCQPLKRIKLLRGNGTTPPAAIEEYPFKDK